MKERPILFRADMVRAIFDGHKTQTRRIAKHPLAQAAAQIHNRNCYTEFDCVTENGGGGLIRCPYGVPGDRLWVRETWCEFADDAIDDMGVQVYHRAEPANESPTAIETMKRNGVVWRPSIFMPRRAARIVLEIVAVRVERLMEISEADAQHEGIDLKNFRSQTEGIAGREHRIHFRDLWESINGAGSWDANLWVWVVEFRRVTP